MDLRFSQSQFYEVDLIPHIRPNLAAFTDTEGIGARRVRLGDSAPRGEWQRAGKGVAHTQCSAVKSRSLLGGGSNYHAGWSEEMPRPQGVPPR